MLTVNKKQLCEDEHIAAGFRLCELIRDFGYDAYLVGGCVRDILFNKHVHDVDVATNMPMDEIIANIEPTCTIEKIIKPVYNFKAAF